MKKISLQVNSDVILEDGIELFFRKCRVKNLSEQTIVSYQDKLKKFINYLGADYPVADITEETVDNFILSLRDEQLKETTINTYLRAVRSLLYYLMESDKMRHFKIQMLKTEEVIKETYTEDELRRLLKKPDMRKASFNEYRIWVLENYLLATGNRISTALTIQIKDIDFANGLITLRKTKNRKQQIIPLSHSLIQILQEYIEIRGGSGEDYLFCNNWGGKPNKRTFQQCVADYNIKRGVNKTSCHLFRHTFAKMWILNGGDAFRLQKMLGHSTLEVTRKYVQMFSNDLQLDFNSFNPLESLELNRGNTIKIRGQMPPYFFSLLSMLIMLS